MTGFDFSPLFRTAIGFDRLARLVDTAQEAASSASYPRTILRKRVRTAIA
jgi:molecular chaperone IbpA